MGKDIAREIDAHRVELTPRQIRDLEGYLKIWRDPNSTDVQRDDAAGIAMGYLGSALRRCKS